MKSHHDIPPLTQDVIYGLTHGLFDDEVGEALLRIWGNEVCDDRIVAMIRGRAGRERLRQAINPFPFRPPQLDDGELILGTSLDGRLVRIPIQYLNAHCLTTAGSGAGKTTKSRLYALMIAPRVRGLWLVDLRKREFRVLRQVMALLKIDLIILPARELRLNPLQVPVGVDPREFVPRVADMLIQVFGLPPGASRLIQIHLYELYQQLHVLDGSTLYPTLFELLESIRNDRQANAQSRQALIANLEPVLLRLGEEVLGWRLG